MQGNQVRWISESQVAELVSLNEAIEALREFVVEEAAGRAENVTKALGVWDDGALHAVGAVAPSAGYAGFKTWAHTSKGAQAVFSLFDAKEGKLLAVIEAVTLGSLRTGGISGLATDWFANADADEFGLIGTGRQAMLQLAAVSAVRKLRRVKVFSPRPESRQAFVEKAKEHFQFEIAAANTMEEAVSQTPIVTLITRAREPFLDSSLISPGTHVNAAGAILPGHAEFYPELFDKLSLFAVDYPEGVATYSEEYKRYLERNSGVTREPKRLGQYMMEGVKRHRHDDITLFKPMGMGISDLAVAAQVYRKACQKELGTSITTNPKHLLPRWQSL